MNSNEVMKANLGKQILGRQDGNVEILVEETNKCDRTPPQARKHSKMHSGEELNKCNQCKYETSRAGDLRRHLKTHSGEKQNKCNQCNYASSQAGHLRTHLKTHSGEKPNKCN